MRNSRDVRIIASSPYFDREWYFRSYPDVQASGADPAVHYVICGAAQGRDPSPYFDTDWYVDQNPDVARARINPLVHYIQHGKAENRLPRAGDEHFRPTATKQQSELSLKIEYLRKFVQYEEQPP